MTGLENGTADACIAGLCGLGAQSAGDPERLYLCTGRRNGEQSLMKSQRYMHRNVAVCVTPLRSVAAPHLGASKIEMQMRVASEVARSIISALRGDISSGVSTLPFLPAKPA